MKLILLITILLYAFPGDTLLPLYEFSGFQNKPQEVQNTRGFQQDRTISIKKLSFIENPQHEHQLYVVVFLGPDCPISQKYMHTLREMHNRYGETITFFGLIPANFSEEQLLKFKKEYTIPFKLVKDPKNSFAAEFKASVTPEAFFFDNLGQIYYDGAIDDWFYALGRNKLKPTTHYLEDAIKDLKAGRMVATPHADAVGCLIEYKRP